MNKKPTSINVRLGEELLQEVRVSAAHNAHSMNAEMIRLVRLALREETSGTVHMSEAEEAWLGLYRLMDDEQRRSVIAFFKSILEKDSKSKAS